MKRARTRATTLVAVVAAAAAWVTLVSPQQGRAATPTGTTTRSSVTNQGTQSPTGGGQSEISGNARYQIFSSLSDLNPDQPGNGEHPCDCDEGDGRLNEAIYVRDLAAKRTDQVTVGAQQEVSARRSADAADGPLTTTPDDDSNYGSISSDGRYIAFATAAHNTVYPYDDRDEPTAIDVCDRGAPDANGVYRPVPEEGGEFPTGFACYTVAGVNVDLADLEDYAPHLSADASRIVWASREDDYHVVHSLALSFDPKTGDLRAPVTANIRSFGAPDGQGVDGDTSDYSFDQPQISANGRYLVMTGFRENSESRTIVEADLRQPTPPVRRVDVAAVGDGVRYVGDVAHPTVSRDGTEVAYDVDNNPSGDDNEPQVYLNRIDTSGFADDRDTPAAPATLESFAYGAGSDRPADGAYPTLSADGRYLAFVSDRAAVWNGADDADGATSCLQQPYKPFAARAAAPTPSGTPSGSSSGSPSGSGSSSGGDGEGRTACQIVARDLIADAGHAANRQPPAVLASPGADAECAGATPDGTCPGGADSDHPVSISARGSRIAYDSAAEDLTSATDTNDSTDAFVRTWKPPLTGDDVNFGEVQVGASADQPLTLKVDGFGPIPVGSVTITGAAKGDYTLDTSSCPQLDDVYLHEYDGDPPTDDGCTVTVTFTPSTAGDRPATIVVSRPADLDEPATVITTIPVDGTGTKAPPSSPPSSPSSSPTKRPPAFAADPTHVDFGSAVPRKVGGTTRTVTLSNPGGSPLTISSIAVTDSTVPGARSDYTVVHTACGSGATVVIAAGRTCVVTVRWSGQAVGRRDASLTVTAASPVGTRVIPLFANVPKPTLTVNPAVLVAGRVTGVSGEGFAPNATIDVASPFSADVFVKTSKTGSFSASLLVLNTATAGPRNVTATMPALDPSITATTPLLVVLGSQQGPVLVQRH